MPRTLPGEVINIKMRTLRIEGASRAQDESGDAVGGQSESVCIAAELLLCEGRLGECDPVDVLRR